MTKKDTKNNDLKSLSQIPNVRPTPDAIPTNQRIAFDQRKGREPVVNGDITYKPVDIFAARVVAKAPWWAEPPQPEPIFMKPEEFKEEPPRLKSYKHLDEKGVVHDDYINRNEALPLAVDVQEKIIKKEIRTSEELVRRSRELVDTVDYLVSEVKGPWNEYQEWVKTALERVREQRIALSSETRLLMQSLKEVREFFLEDSYQTQINRLHEFIDLCERLQALKQSGFLDAVTDTILKM
jgi:hypothetical protein